MTVLTVVAETNYDCFLSSRHDDFSVLHLARILSSCCLCITCTSMTRPSCMQRYEIIPQNIAYLNIVTSHGRDRNEAFV